MGTVRFAGLDLQRLDDDQLSSLRRSEIGLVFQAFHLLDGRENVVLPLRSAGICSNEALSRAQEALSRVGLGRRLPSGAKGRHGSFTPS